MTKAAPNALAKAVPVADTNAEMWAVWRALVKAFSLKALMRRLSYSKSGWGFYSADVISGFRNMPMADAGRRILASQSEAQLRRLKALATLNAGRNDALWKMAALFYVSVPLSMFVAGFQVFPKTVRALINQGGMVLVVAFVLAWVMLLHYFAANWRARQIETLIELELVERGAEIGGKAG